MEEEHKQTKKSAKEGNSLYADEYEPFEDAEDFFSEVDAEDEEDEYVPQPSRKWIKVGVAIILTVAMLSNIVAFWPQVYNLQAIQFIIKSRQLSQNEHIQQYKQAVVSVEVDDRKGTGFNIAKAGLIITNDHVVGDEKRAYVIFPNGEKYQAEVIINDPAIDIAILRIDAEGADLPALELQTAEDWAAGESIYFIGNPLFFTQIANEGHILGMITLEDWELPVMMLQAPIYKGNSGSPVINQDGEVIAVIFATIKIERNHHTGKVGLAIPIHYLRSYLDIQ